MEAACSSVFVNQWNFSFFSGGNGWELKGRQALKQGYGKVWTTVLGDLGADMRSSTSLRFVNDINKMFYEREVSLF